MEPGTCILEEHSDAVQICWDGIRKAKTQLELNLARNAKYNSRSFYKHIAQKSKNKENMNTKGPPPINKTGEQVITDMEKAEIYSVNFASIFMGNGSSHTSHVHESQGRDWGNKVPAKVGEDQL